MPQRSQSDAQTNRTHPPSSTRSITEVLCREVGANHPDGALKQIRTMKRLLRSHYRVQQRLEEYGVESLDEAVSRIAGLTEKVETLKAQQRRQARRQLTIIESLLDKMQMLRNRTGQTPSAAPASPSPNLLREAVDLIDALTTELDELRLELWLYRSDDATTSDRSPGATASALLERLDDTLRQAQKLVDQVHENRSALKDENQQLRREADRLRTTVERQQQRIEDLERAQESPLAPTNSQS